MKANVNLLNSILDTHNEETFLKADGFDAAVIGLDGRSMRLIYSYKKCLKILVEDGMSLTEAMEHFDYNVADAFVGDKTPIWCMDDYEPVKKREISERVMREWEIFWKKYGKSVDKMKSFEKWIGLRDKDRKVILETVDDYVAAHPDPKFRKNPCTYFNNKCWLDESYIRKEETKKMIM